MTALGAGIAIWGAWQFASNLLREPHQVVRDMNKGCAWTVALFAASATMYLLDILAGNG